MSQVPGSRADSLKFALDFRNLMLQIKIHLPVTSFTLSEAEGNQ